MRPRQARRLPESSVRPEAGSRGCWEAAASGTGVLCEALVPKRRQVPRGRSHGSHGATSHRPAEGVPPGTLVLREAHASGRSAIQDSGAQRGPCQRPSFQGRLTLLVAALAAGDQVRPVLIYHLKILGPLRIVLNLLCLCSVNEQQSWDDSNLLHSLLFLKICW